MENHTQETQGIRPHVSCRSSDQSTHVGHPSHLDSHYRSRSQKSTTPSSVDYVRKLYFNVGTIQRICLFSDGLYCDNTLILTTMQCMDVSARPHVCGVCLTSRKKLIGFRVRIYILRILCVIQPWIRAPP
jgi:hypothetical protein